MRLEHLYRIRFTYPQRPELVLDVAELIWEPVAP